MPVVPSPLRCCLLAVLAAPGRRRQAATSAADPSPVDTTSRATVRQAYVDRWLPAVSTTITPAGGSTSACTPYTTSSAQQDASASAIKFARGLAGEGAITLDPAYDLQAARVALVMAANKNLSHDSTARLKSSKVTVTMLLEATDGTHPTGTVGLWSNGSRIGTYTFRATDAGSKVVTLGPFRRAGVRNVHAAFQGTPSYVRSQSRTTSFTVR